MRQLVCLVLLLSCKISKCDMNLKRSTSAGDPLIGFLLNQMTRFGAKLDKLNDQEINRGKEMHQVEKALIKATGDLETKLEKNERKLNKFNDENKTKIKRLSEILLKTKSIADVNKEQVTKLWNNLKRQKDEFGNRRTNVDNRVKNLQKQIDDAMRKASASRPGCQSGVYGQHAYPQVKFPTQTYIRFSPPFPHTPSVSYGLYLLDSNKDQNVRVSTNVSGISKSGFTLGIGTFSNTVMWGARISWMACPKYI